MNLHVLPHLTVETGPNPVASVIWLHGLGADGHDFEPVVPQLGLPADLPVRFIFPHAPSMPVTLNGGYIMPAWYDIKETDLGIEHDRKGITESARDIQMLIEQETLRGMKPERIILAGFSQGAAMALHVGVRQGEKLAGIMALSGYLLLPTETDTFDAKAKETPIFMAHGIHDPVVNFALGDSSHRKLTAAGCTVEWHTYPMEHQVCMEEIKQIGKWIAKTLNG
ncbi:phospholipase/carboxylesterase [Mariprofundus micogutta]|uniref:Phospholipase/carboxylesterase n=1 Tax=Mariprofundus micogutta TaxID=1921010 RepID=A0A1L8CKU3_9PROT|nr:dienelactone hydrolase family protein [Mariprofundus micogutta]GAV19521.1 phospholipase/carboxylesterase [Mariprofundus micogutta]